MPLVLSVAIYVHVKATCNFWGNVIILKLHDLFGVIFHL